MFLLMGVPETDGERGERKIAGDGDFLGR
jgi:hypothetical protein